MSFVQEATWAAAPATDRFHPTPLSADSKGERIAYAANKSIFVRSIDQPEVSREHTGHTAQTTVARFAPSGFYVASGDVTGTIRIWDCVGEGATKGTYGIVNGRINDIAWDGDSQRVIAVGDGKERFGHCITADSGNSVGEISGHNKEIHSVTIRQQRPLRAATASADRTVAFFHGAPFKYNTSMRSQHTNGEVMATAFSPDGSLLVSVGRDKSIWLYDGKTGEELRQVSKDDHKGSILGVSWAPDSKRFVTCAADKTVKLWDAESGKVAHTWTMNGDGPAGHQCGVVWPHGRTDGLVISLDGAGNLNYLYPDSEKPRKIIQGHQKSIATALLVPSSPPALITGGSDAAIRVWDLSSGLATELDGQGHDFAVSGIAAPAAARGSNTVRAYSIGVDDKLRPIDVAAKTFTGSGVVATDGAPKGVAVTRDDLVVVATASSISVYSAADGTKKGSVAVTNAVPVCIAASPSSDEIVVGCNKSLQVYSVSSSGTLSLKKSVTEGVKAEVSALAFSPGEGTYLAAGTALGGISVFKAADWTLETARWSSHTARVTSLAWSPDATHAVSGSLDTNVHLWSLAQPGKRVKAGNAHKDGVNGMVWLPSDDGPAKVLSAGADGSVKVWKVEGLDK